MGGVKDKYIVFADPEVERICVANWSSDGIGVTYEDAAKVTTLNQKFNGNTTIVSFMELEYFINVTKLRNSEFQGCSSLEYVFLKNITDWSEYYQLLSCTSLKAIELAETVTSLPHNSISGNSLESIQVSSQFTSFAEGNFSNVWLIDDWDFWPDTLASIPTTNNIIFRTYIVPKNVTSVGNRAFSGNANHRDATRMQWVAFLPITPPTFGGNPFYVDYLNSKVYVPDASVNAYKTANNFTANANRVYPISQMATDYPTDWEKYKDRFVGLY